VRLDFWLLTFRRGYAGAGWARAQVSACRHGPWATVLPHVLHGLVEAPAIRLTKDGGTTKQRMPCAPTTCASPSIPAPPRRNWAKARAQLPAASIAITDVERRDARPLARALARQDVGHRRLIVLLEDSGLPPTSVHAREALGIVRHRVEGWAGGRPGDRHAVEPAPDVLPGTAVPLERQVNLENWRLRLDRLAVAKKLAEGWWYRIRAAGFAAFSATANGCVGTTTTLSIGWTRHRRDLSGSLADNFAHD